MKTRSSHAGHSQIDRTSVFIRHIKDKLDIQQTEIQGFVDAWKEGNLTLILTRSREQM